MTEIKQEQFLWDKEFNGFSSSFLSENGGLKILWWNVQYGVTNRLLEASMSQRALDLNLRMLVSSQYAPDVIALGEYSDDSFSKETNQLLNQRYPFSLKSFVPYNPDTPERGVMVYSKHPLRLVNSAHLDYYPLGMQDQGQIQDYKQKWAKGFPPERFFPRTYLNYEIDKDGKKVHLVPFHALIHAEKLMLDSGGGFFTTLYLKLTIAFGSENPLIYQLKRFRKHLEGDFGEKLDQFPLVILGDLNLPRKFSIFTTKPYKVISQALVDPFENSEEVTWPMPSSEEFKKFDLRMQFDHMLVNSKVSVSTSQILPFKGSDHAAIYTLVN